MKDKLYNFVTIVVILMAFQKPCLSAVQETRVLFDEEFSWVTRDGTDKLVKTAKNAGFNVLIPCVWHGRGVSWNSTLAPKEPRWEKVYEKGFDPFSYLLQRAHAEGISVHPWFTVSLRQRDFFEAYYDSGTPPETFNIQNPDFQKFIVSVMLDVAKKYSVDGINLDYIRSRGYCKSSFCKESYTSKYERDLSSDILLEGMSNDAADHLRSWNSDAVNSIVKSLSAQIKAIKPDIIISVDSLAGDETWAKQGANSIDWVNKNLIDFVFHMDYGNPLNQSHINNVHSNLNDKTKLTILLGNYKTINGDEKNTTSRSQDEVAQLINSAKQLWPENNVVAMYEYRFLTDGQIDMLTHGPFKEKAISRWPVHF